MSSWLTNATPNTRSAVAFCTITTLKEHVLSQGRGTSRVTALLLRQYRELHRPVWGEEGRQSVDHLSSPHSRKSTRLLTNKDLRGECVPLVTSEPASVPSSPINWQALLINFVVSLSFDVAEIDAPLIRSNLFSKPQSRRLSLQALPGLNSFPTRRRFQVSCVFLTTNVWPCAECSRLRQSDLRLIYDLSVDCSRMSLNTRRGN